MVLLERKRTLLFDLVQQVIQGERHDPPWNEFAGPSEEHDQDQRDEPPLCAEQSLPFTGNGADLKISVPVIPPGDLALHRLHVFPLQKPRLQAEPVVVVDALLGEGEQRRACEHKAQRNEADLAEEEEVDDHKHHSRPLLDRQQTAHIGRQAARIGCTEPATEAKEQGEHQGHEQDLALVRINSVQHLLLSQQGGRQRLVHGSSSR